MNRHEVCLFLYLLSFCYTSDWTLRGLGAQTEVEPIEKVHRSDCSVEMSEVEEACLAPPSCAARTLADASTPSTGRGRIRHSIDQEKG